MSNFMFHGSVRNLMDMIFSVRIACGSLLIDALLLVLLV